ncbi:MAG TPA: FAD-dependent oxidoreductase [Ideonella sp.]|jgi:3-phenylpropionate/trans-cinnamate dioxygenase ferredoxin reductase subunit|nr:FAD-dependent oxidoreductase [Ideonella sp.]
MNSDGIVIVGTGQAGGWAAQTLRKEGFAGQVALIGEEPHRPYERPLLSKAVLAGEASAESTQLISVEAFEKLGLDWRANVRVTSIDRAGRQVLLSTGERIGYGKLILCSGGRARTLNIPGADLPGVFTLRNIDDARALGAALLPGKSLVVVGGGWIGLEVAATARKKGMEVTVVEAMTRLCERSVPPHVSQYLSRLHSRHGTQVMLGTGVAAFARPAGGRLVAALSDGRELACDAVVVGIGLIPNDELARDAGLACDGGVVVDAQCRTSDPSILAAGDVASWHCPWGGRRMRLESWQNAQEQGIAAGRSALGIEVDHQPLPWFWSDQYDINLQIYGVPDPSHQVVVRGDLQSDSFVLFYLDGSQVRSAMGPNAARDLRLARRLIESRRSVDPQVLADTNVAMSRV